MKAIRVHEYGGADKFLFEDAPEPQAAAGQVLVRVMTASLNPFDYKLASGAFQKLIPMSLPYIPGGDFCGIVESSNAPGFKPQEAVYGNAPFGAWAEFIAADSKTIAPKPKTLTEIEAASIPVVGQTAWQALFDHGKLQSGQTVLIHGAAGGVGSFAVQLAHWKGAKVLATAGAENADYLRSLGADQTIDYKSSPFESVAKDIDLVIDLIGGETQARSFGVLKAGGRLVTTVQPPSQDEAKKHNIHAEFFSMKPSTANLTALAQLLDAQTVRPPISKSFPLSEVQPALEALMSRHTRGKLVFLIAHLK